LLPNYHAFHINLAIITDIKGDTTAASIYFKRASVLGPAYPESWFFYGRYLINHQHYTAAIPYLQKSLELSPAQIYARMLLMRAYSETGQWSALKNIAQETQKLIPDNASVKEYLSMADAQKNGLDMQESLIDAQPDANKYIDLSLGYYQKGDYTGSIRAAEKALKIKPNFAEAYNNIGSSYIALKEYNKAIPASQKAIELIPDFTNAKNNLQLALTAQKK
jgi:tetratricopeptide (TPR) repeat protein